MPRLRSYRSKRSHNRTNTSWPTSSARARSPTSRRANATTGSRWRRMITAMAASSPRPIAATSSASSASSRCCVAATLIPLPPRRARAAQADPECTPEHVLTGMHRGSYSPRMLNRTPVRCRRGDTNPKYTRPLGGVARRGMTASCAGLLPELLPTSLECARHLQRSRFDARRTCDASVSSRRRYERLDTSFWRRECGGVRAPSCAPRSGRCASRQW